MFFRNGYPVISVSLPSKGEDCDFMLNPLNETVGDFVDHLKKEDGGIERAILYTKQGAKIAKSTRLDQLFIEDFDLLINDNKYHVSVPNDCKPYSTPNTLVIVILSLIDKEVFDGTKTLMDARSLIHQLYSALNVDKYQVGYTSIAL